MKFITDILTEEDNQTFCAARVMGVLSVIVFCIVAITHEFTKGIEDFSTLGIGFGGVLGGAGAFLGAKSFTHRDTDANA
jgi:hypothetical protein